MNAAPATGPSVPGRRAVVVGAGISGLSIAGQLLRRAAFLVMGLPGVGGMVARRIFRASLPSKGHPAD